MFFESLHLQFLFILQRLAFMTWHQFFRACPPFVNTVYRVGHGVGDALSQVLFTPSRETIPEVLVKINSASFFLVSKVENGFRRTRDIFL